MCRPMTKVNSQELTIAQWVKTSTKWLAERLIDRIDEGEFVSAIPNLSLYRFDEPSIRLFAAEASGRRCLI